MNTFPDATNNKRTGVTADDEELAVKMFIPESLHAIGVTPASQILFDNHSHSFFTKNEVPIKSVTYY